MKGVVPLLVCLTIVTLVGHTAICGSSHPTPRTLANATLSLSAGQAYVWKSLTNANVRVTAHNSGSEAVHILLMPLERWQQWQSCTADAEIPTQLEPGASAIVSRSGSCLQPWVVSISHVEDPGCWPKPGNATVHLTADGALPLPSPLMTGYRNISQNVKTGFILDSGSPSVVFDSNICGISVQQNHGIGHNVRHVQHIINCTLGWCRFC